MTKPEVQANAQAVEDERGRLVFMLPSLEIMLFRSVQRDLITMTASLKPESGPALGYIEGEEVKHHERQSRS
jgi:hypothetical protein